MSRYLVTAFLALLCGGVVEYLEVTTPTALAIGECNTNCRLRKYFKHCGSGTTDGSCRYYEEGTCEHCQNTGWCDAYDFASPWPCMRKLNTLYYDEPDDNCIRHCGCPLQGFSSPKGACST